jgi:hypothetical protein
LVNEGADGEVKVSMWIENEEKLSGNTCAYVGLWGPKKWKYGGELLYFSSFLIKCGGSVSYLKNGMGPIEGM